MDKVRVSRAVATLTEQGILERRVCGSDSRASILSLSGEGRALYERLAPQALAWERDLLQPLSLDERKALTDILDKLEGRLADMNTGANQ